MKRIKVKMLEGDLFNHGTTAVINTVVRRKGAKICLICTNRFTDVLRMGREQKEVMGRMKSQRI